MGRRNSADLNMGVLACYRNGCTNIMCDRYSHEHGYICYDCFEELVDIGFTMSIEDFMKTTPKPNNRDAKEAYFNLLFPLRQ